MNEAAKHQAALIVEELLEMHANTDLLPITQEQFIALAYLVKEAKYEQA